MYNIHNLPRDVSFLIFCQLSKQSLYNLFVATKHFTKIGQDDTFWLRKIIYDFQDVDWKRYDKSYLELYKQLSQRYGIIPNTDTLVKKVIEYNHTFVIDNNNNLVRIKVSDGPASSLEKYVNNAIGHDNTFLHILKNIRDVLSIGHESLILTVNGSLYQIIALPLKIPDEFARVSSCNVQFVYLASNVKEIGGKPGYSYYITMDNVLFVLNSDEPNYKFMGKVKSVFLSDYECFYIDYNNDCYELGCTVPFFSFTFNVKQFVMSNYIIYALTDQGIIERYDTNDDIVERLVPIKIKDKVIDKIIHDSGLYALTTSLDLFQISENGSCVLKSTNVLNKFDDYIILV